MKDLIVSRVSFIWLALVGATVLSFLMGNSFGSSDLRFAGTVILIISFIKVRFVMSEFMELRNAPFALRFMGDFWCVAVCALLVVLFLAPPA